MKKVKFNKFERVAGIFVLIAVFGFFVSMLSVAIKQGWFDSKVYFTTQFKNADGVHPGTQVQISGLKAGSVESVELLGDNHIQVKFYVLGKFSKRVKEDSVAQLIRPFIIGERVLDISVGSADAMILVSDSMMTSQESMDLMTLMSGKELGQNLAVLSEMTKNLRKLAEAFLDTTRTDALINIFDRVDPLLKNMNTMSVEVIKLSKQATQDNRLGVVLGELSKTTKEINALIPELQGKAPQMAQDMTQIVRNLAILTEEFKAVLPALAEVAPELPQTTRRAVEALNETVVLIKALQKSMFVRGNVKEVREEEADKRQPASEK